VQGIKHESNISKTQKLTVLTDTINWFGDVQWLLNFDLTLPRASVVGMIWGAFQQIKLRVVNSN